MNTHTKKEGCSILFCTGIFPPDIGGPATYVKNLSLRLSEKNIPNHIITYSNQKNGTYGNVTYIYRKKILSNYIRYFIAVIKFARHYKTVYIQGSFSEGIPSVLAGKILKKKMIMRIGGVFSWEYANNKKLTTDDVQTFLEKKQRLLPRILKMIDYITISHCHYIIANSNYSKKLLTLIGIKEEKIHVIYNAFTEFPVMHIKHNEKKKKENYIILVVSRLVTQKNIDKIIEQFATISNKYKLYIIGDGPQKQTLQQQTKDLHLKDHVLFLGKKNKNELYEQYRNADYLVLYSSYEGMSHVLLEATQHKLPIIASDIEPNIETLKHYPHKIFVKVSHPHALQNAIQNIHICDCKEKHTIPKDFDEQIIFNKTIKLLCM